MSIVFSFSSDLQWSQEKIKTMLMQNFGGKTEYYGIGFLKTACYCLALLPSPPPPPRPTLQQRELHALLPNSVRFLGRFLRDQEPDLKPSERMHRVTNCTSCPRGLNNSSVLADLNGLLNSQSKDISPSHMTHQQAYIRGWKKNKSFQKR